jgi:hypothetical protein
MSLVNFIGQGSEVWIWEDSPWIHRIRGRERVVAKLHFLDQDYMSFWRAEFPDTPAYILTHAVCGDSEYGVAMGNTKEDLLDEIRGWEDPDNPIVKKAEAAIRLMFEGREYDVPLRAERVGLLSDFFCAGCGNGFSELRRALLCCQD